MRLSEAVHALTEVVLLRKLALLAERIDLDRLATEVPRLDAPINACVRACAVRAPHRFRTVRQRPIGITRG